jgi:hypothetical protein
MKVAKHSGRGACILTDNYDNLRLTNYTFAVKIAYNNG